MDGFDDAITRALSPISDEEADRLWKQLCNEHYEPSRLFRLAKGMIPLTPADAVHLRDCQMCGHWYRIYLKTP
jgi:hypothetical protein